MSRSASSSKVAASTAIVAVYNEEIRGMLEKEVVAVLEPKIETQQPQFKELEIEVERQISAIRVVRDVDIERLLMELRLVRSCFSEEQIWKPMLQVFKETLTNLSIVKDEGNGKFDVKWKERGSRVSTTCGGVGRDLHASLFQRLSIAFPSEYPSSIPQFGGFEYSSNTVEHQISAIRVVRDVDIERLLMELRLVRSCFSEEQLWKPMLQVFEETLTNLSIVKDEGNEKFDLKWKERGSRVSTTCGGVGRDLHASLFQRLSIAFPSEYPSSIPQFGGFEYSSNTEHDFLVFEEPCEAQTLTSQEGLQTPNVSSQRLSVGMTPKTFRLPKPGETLLCPWITAIRVVRDVDIERLLMELRLVRSCFSEEQLWKPMLQVFEETLTNLSIVKDEGNEKFDLKWKERGSRVSTTCGGVGRDLHASLFQRLSIAFPSEYPSSIPQFGGFEYSSNTEHDFLVFEEPCEAQTLTSQEGLQTPNVSSQRLSVGMTPKTFRLPKPGETLLCPWITFLRSRVKLRLSQVKKVFKLLIAIRVVRDVDIERLLMELRLVRSCFSEEQLWKPMLQVFEETLTNLSIVKDEGNEKFDLKWKERGSRVSTTCGGVFEEPCEAQTLTSQEVERQISAIRVVRDVDIERLLMELRLVRSCFSEEQLRKPMLQVFEQILPNLSIVKDEGNGKFDVKWKERGSKMSTTCGGVGRDLHASLFQRLSIAFPSECPSSVPQFGGFEYSSNTGFLGDENLHFKDFVFEEPCEAQTLTSQEVLQTPNVSSQRLSVGMTPKTLRLPKPGEMLLSVHGSPLGVYKENNMEAIYESEED
ncbi:hypothetical protein HN51_046048 [Arachis hypogaea]